MNETNALAYNATLAAALHDVYSGQDTLFTDPAWRTAAYDFCKILNSEGQTVYCDIVTFETFG